MELQISVIATFLKTKTESTKDVACEMGARREYRFAESASGGVQADQGLRGNEQGRTQRLSHEQQEAEQVEEAGVETPARGYSRS